MTAAHGAQEMGPPAGLQRESVPPASRAGGSARGERNRAARDALAQKTMDWTCCKQGKVFKSEQTESCGGKNGAPGAAQ